MNSNRKELHLKVLSCKITYLLNYMLHFINIRDIEKDQALRIDTMMVKLFCILKICHVIILIFWGEIGLKWDGFIMHLRYLLCVPLPQEIVLKFQHV